MIRSFNRWCQGILLTLCALVSVSAFPKEANVDFSSMTLKQYIKYKCKAGCIDSKIVLDAVKATAKTRDLDYKRLLAIITVESGFINHAVNGKSVGLMQINLDYHEKKFRLNPFNVWDNIRVGGIVYKACVRKHNGDVMKSLRCYNGEGNKTFSYSDKVMVAYKEIIQLKDLDVTVTAQK